MPSCFSRRVMLGGLGLGAAALAIAPAQADDKVYEAMLLKCIDPRFTTFTWQYMKDRGWQNLYSQFNIAGGPIGVAAPVFDSWHETFWENLDISVGLHEVSRVLAITHRDCAAAAIAYGDEVLTNWDYETQMHTEALHTFRSELAQRQPQLGIELGIMDLNGHVEPVD
jgi:hypothetical protein